VLVFFLLLGTVLVGTFRMKPVFQATAVLEIRKTGESGMSLENLFSEDLGAGGDKDLNTEVEILKSWPVAEETARLSGHQLVLDRSRPLYETLFRRLKHRFKGMMSKEESDREGLTGDLVQDSNEPFRVESLAIPALERSFAFKAKFSDDASFCVMDEHGEPFARGIIGRPCTTPLFSFTFHGTLYLERSVFPFIIRPLSQAAQDIRSNLEVSPIRNTRLIRLILTSRDPDEARRLLSSVIAAYQHRKIEQKTLMASRALDFIDKQLNAVDEHMQEAVNKLKRFKEERRLVSLSDSVRVAVDQVAELEKKEQELILLHKQSEFLLSMLEGQQIIDQESLYSLGNAMGQPVLISLANDLSQLQGHRASLRSQYTELHPTIQAMDKNMATVKGKIKAEVSSLANSIESQQKALAQEILVAEKRLEKLPEAEKHLADLTRQAKVYQDTYSFMLEKKGELQVTKASQLGDIWVVEPAHAGHGFVKPNVKKNVLLALILGLALGIGLAFFLDYLDASIKNEEDIQSIVTLPVLGTIGHHHQPKNRRGLKEPDLFLLEDSGSQLAESFRTLRANMLFISVDKPRRLIALSSPLPEDGKTTCAANLAVALSQMGKKVLLVDADLRKSYLHRVFHLDRSPGLSTVLAENDWQTTLGKAIRKTEMHGLYLLASGERPPNPNEMLASEKMGQLIDLVSRRFDFLLFDTPPLLQISDAVVLSQRLDAVVLVVRSGKTSKDSLKDAVELLSNAQTDIIGVVLNDIDFRRERYYYAYQYKYYGKYYDGKAGYTTGGKKGTQVG